MKNKSYICHIPYLRNSMAYDHNFWYLQMIFFHFFRILIFWVASGKKGKKWPKMTTNCHITYCHLWYTFVKMISPLFFFFFQIWIFWVVRRRGGSKKWSKMTKNYVSRAPYLRSHTLYDCHLWYTRVK